MNMTLRRHLPLLALSLLAFTLGLPHARADEAAEAAQAAQAAFTFNLKMHDDG